MKPARAARLIIASAVAIVFAVAGVARADGMRCGSLLVSQGDTIYRVESRCGAPIDVRTWVEYRSVKVRVGNFWVDRMVEVKFEEWTYDQGPERLVRFVLFEDGRLAQVNTGSYGEGKR